MKKYILEITVFICGAISMILELVAARVLSPYVGSSNLIWTTIIGVMLISMSIDRKSTRLNSSHSGESRMPSSA